MMFEWSSMLANTESPPRSRALAYSSAEELIPPPWGPPIIHETSVRLSSDCTDSLTILVDAVVSVPLAVLGRLPPFLILRGPLAGRLSLSVPLLQVLPEAEPGYHGLAGKSA